MACSNDRANEAGFATAAAMTVSMGLAMVAAGLMAASATELKRERTELAKTRTEYALDEAQHRAVLGLLQNDVAGRLRWQVETDLGSATVLAEPEYAKASLSKSAAADDRVFERLGVDDADELKAQLRQSPPEAGGQAWLASLDPAPLWRACAPSMISRYGGGDTLVVGRVGSPDQRGFFWRPGEVWRVKTSLKGWADDRIVRFTGDDQSPAATIERRFLRTDGRDDLCDTIFSQGA